MSDLAIQVENLSKAYQLGEFSTGTLTKDIHRWWMLTRGKEDPYLKIGETNDRSVKGTSDIVWSLKDINFEIKEGDAVGIIGRNGAGKSTLLKILSRVTAPTTGNINVKGRIASLLEVGTGFHPELTGGENIYLNGAIMGMKKREIKQKFDEIVDFAGVERYIDTPVKRYSSGMYVRLAFAVAAYLDSEILVVDEVLAVGDAEFQKKCLGKMSDVSQGQGRTILFVSHNMSAIQSLCSNALVLEHGKIGMTGSIEPCISHYLSNKEQNRNIYTNCTAGTRVKQLRIVDSELNLLESINNEQDCFFELTIVNEFANNLNFGFTIFNDREIPLISKVILDDLPGIENGETAFVIRIPNESLTSGRYTIEGGLWDNSRLYEKNPAYLIFEYISNNYVEKTGQKYLGLMRCNTNWIVKK